MSTLFKAYWVTEESDQTFKNAIIERSTNDLPAGEVLIEVHYSSLNYKDALSASGNKGVTRNYPHTPGIDAAGVVVESNHPDVKTGDAVIVTSYDLGMNTSGGYGQYIRVPAEWVIKLPENLSLRESMILGTAGFTAGLSMYYLIRGGVRPEHGPIVVTGASGGVGSLAVALLAKKGYEVIAITGKEEAAEMLKMLGATTVEPRSVVDDDSKRPLLKGRFAGAIDTVGGNMLATILRSTKHNGVVTCCGLVNSPKLHTTVFPFILRGISLIGVDSQSTEKLTRQKIWDHLGSDWKPSQLEQITEECSLEGLREKIDLILKGQIKGRTLVNLKI